jgi:uncharacterized protein YjiS (DUF1127 family)
MESISALVTADFPTAAAAKKPSLIRIAVDALATMVSNAQRASADRNLRAELAAMDDAMLRDIGVAEDELYLIRARQNFTPRAWTSKAVAARGWPV